MRGGRRSRILADLHAATTAEDLCELSRHVVGVTGAGIMLMAGDVRLGSVCTTGEVSGLLEDLQYTLGEGPCLDAYHHDRPVHEPDLADPDTPRWLAFTGPALDAGVRAVFGFPMTVGAARMGALNLYSDHPGSLTDDQHADALVMADVAAQAVLDIQAGAPDGVVSAGLERGSNFHTVVHQAAGMVSEQLHVSLAEGIVRLRAFAFGNELDLVEVATDVVGRRLRMDDGPGPGRVVSTH